MTEQTSKTDNSGNLVVSRRPISEIVGADYSNGEPIPDGVHIVQEGNVVVDGSIIGIKL